MVDALLVVEVGARLLLGLLLVERVRLVEVVIASRRVL